MLIQMCAKLNEIDSWPFINIVIHYKEHYRQKYHCMVNFGHKVWIDKEDLQVTEENRLWNSINQFILVLKIWFKELLIAWMLFPSNYISSFSVNKIALLLDDLMKKKPLEIMSKESVPFNKPAPLGDWPRSNVSLER